MTPEAATNKQVELLRAMTGEQRLELALNLHKSVSDLSRAGIRRQFPEADADEVERQLRRRIESSRE